MVGTTLSHYTITQKLGQGGMGEVYLAEDTTLKRPVAIKVLPEQVHQDEEHLQRFRTEAESVAQLNHPNIAHIYSIEEENDILFITMEYIEGDALTQLIPEQGIPQEMCLEWFIQFMDGLTHAHQKGICHRDIKSSNLMVTKDGLAKILDFGLAQITRPEPDSAIIDSQSPTKSMATVLGTVAYMSPEQAGNKPVNFASDIFSMGIVMYESLAGRRPFLGDSTFTVASSILRDNPPVITALRPDISPHLGRIINKSLQKDPRKRYQNGREALIDLKEVSDIVNRPPEEEVTVEAVAAVSKEAAVETPAPSILESETTPVPVVSRSTNWPVLAASVVIVFILGMLTMYIASERFIGPSSGQIRKLQFPGGGNLSQNNGPAISPDGHMVAYTQGEQLWIRDFSQLSARMIDDTDGAVGPFWSPHSDVVGYFDRNTSTLKKVPVQGGRSTVLCQLTVPLYGGASWSTEGTIVFSQIGQGHDGLYSIPEQGGKPVTLITPDSITSEIGFRNPSFLSDGRSLVFIVLKDDESSELALQAGGTRTRLYHNPGEVLTFATYSPTGHVLFHSGSFASGIQAIQLSESKRAAVGPPFQVASNGIRPSVSDDGTLVYRSATDAGFRLVWVDRQGKITGTVGQPQDYIQMPAISPDEKHVAVSGTEQGIMDIWIHEVDRNIKTRLTLDATQDFHPSWSPSGDRLAFSSFRKPDGDIFIQASDGSGEATTLAGTEFGEYAPSWSSDERYMVYHLMNPTSKRDLWYLPLSDTHPVPFLQTPFNELLPVLSPDGRYVAYTSKESGRWEVYVRQFPSGSVKQQVSVNGGVSPRWRRNEIFYVENNNLMAASVVTLPVLRVDPPQMLFSGGDVEARLYEGGVPTGWQYDVSPKSGRFIVVQNIDASTIPTINVVENWIREFESK